MVSPRPKPFGGWREMAIGARLIAARRAVVRRLPVVESLGSVDIIRTDKTGTLTENRMTVERLFAGDQIVAAPRGGTEPGPLREALLAGLLCGEATIEDGATPRIIGDPVETGALARGAGRGSGHLARARRISQGKRNPLQLRTEDDDDRTPARWSSCGLRQRRARDDPLSLLLVLAGRSTRAAG